MLEREFQKWVVDTFAAHGWRVFHVPTPMRPVKGGRFIPDPRGRGLPDLMLVHEAPPRLIFAEVKNEDGVLSDDQTEVLRLLRAVALRSGASGTLGPPPPLGVFVFKPGVEPLIEALAAGKYAGAA